MFPALLIRPLCPGAALSDNGKKRNLTRMPHKYLFILSPPYSGSTALWRLLQSSRRVAALPDEGQKLPELRDEMRREPWNPEREFPWARISEVWHGYWDLARPVLLEKSPPHLCRIEQLEAHFRPAWHILLLRDPLATCEGLHRRNGLDWSEAADRWCAWLQMHLHARRHLDRSIVVYYEELVNETPATLAQLARWLPELDDVAADAVVEAHAVDGQQRRQLVDLNPRKIEAIAARDRQQIIERLRRDAAALSRTPYGALYL